MVFIVELMFNSRFNVVNNRHVVIAAGKDSGIFAVEAETKNVAQMLFQHHLRLAFVQNTFLHVPQQHSAIISA